MRSFLIILLLACTIHAKFYLIETEDKGIKHEKNRKYNRMGRMRSGHDYLIGRSPVGDNLLIHQSPVGDDYLIGGRFVGDDYGMKKEQVGNDYSRPYEGHAYPYVPKVECNFEEWSTWTTIGTCGKVDSYRMERHCIKQSAYGPKENCMECVGPSFETANVNLGPCCTWGHWGYWSTSGYAQPTRSRQCTSLTPDVDENTMNTKMFGYCTSVALCPGGATASTETQQNLGHQGNCCNWSDWSANQPCSATCGRGKQARSRQCLASGGNCGYQACTAGTHCTGKNSGTQPCPHLPSCPTP